MADFPNGLNGQLAQHTVMEEFNIVFVTVITLYLNTVEKTVLVEERNGLNAMSISHATVISLFTLSKGYYIPLKTRLLFYSFLQGSLHGNKLIINRGVFRNHSNI